MSEHPSIAAVLTVHNRRDLTLACLDALAAQAVDADLEVYLFDDGSTDGTAEQVAEQHPDVTVLLGDGSFYWNGGMRVAMARARRAEPEWYLWVNDDTTLRPDTVQRLLEVANAKGGADEPLAVVGAIMDPDRGEVVYSGVMRRDFRPMLWDWIGPVDAPAEVDTMNGNCVLISREAVRRVGNLNPNFQHSMGDYDYGLRIRDEGGIVWLAPGIAGECRFNPGYQPVGESVRDELVRFTDTKHLPPVEWGVFVRQWGGRAWPVFWMSPYVKQSARLVGAGISAQVKKLKELSQGT